MHVKMKNRLAVFSVVILSIFFSSCSSKFSLSKRRYTKGYYFDAAQKAPSNKAKANNEGQASPQSEEKSIAKTETIQTKSFASVDQYIEETSSGYAADQASNKFNRKRKLTEPLAFNYKPKQKPTTATFITSKQNNFKRTSNRENNYGPWFNNCGNVGGAFLSVVVGTIASIFFFILLFFLIDALAAGTLGTAALGLFFGILIVVAIAVFLIINGD